MSDKNNSQDKLRWFMLVVAAGLFAATVIVKLIRPETEINSVSTVFVSIAGLVLGSTAVNLFKNNNKE